MTGKALAAGGMLVFLVMTVLLFVGTTSAALFIGYFVVAVAAMATIALGLRLERRATFARLEQEMRDGR